eukprot:510368-Hanusia_phi.AAC.1
MQKKSRRATPSESQPLKQGQSLRRQPLGESLSPTSSFHACSRFLSRILLPLFPTPFSQALTLILYTDLSASLQNSVTSDSCHTDDKQ